MLSSRVLLSLLFVPAIAISQQPGQLQDLRDATAGQIIARAREVTPGLPIPAVVIDVMRQKGKAQPRAKLDEVADSLTVMALHATEEKIGISRLSAIVSAGDLRGEGVPYDGALDRLIRIHRDGALLGVRSAALLRMLSVPGRPRALSFLRATAVSGDRTAAVACDALMRESGDDPRAGGRTSEQRREAEDILRDLYTRALVNEPEARDLLANHARLKGWIKS